MAQAKLKVILREKITLNKFDGPPPRKDRVSKFFKKVLKLPEKQPVEILHRTTDYRTNEITEKIEKTEWEPSKLRSSIEIPSKLKVLFIESVLPFLLNLWEKIKCRLQTPQ